MNYPLDRSDGADPPTAADGKTPDWDDVATGTKAETDQAPFDVRQLVADLSDPLRYISALTATTTAPAANDSRTANQRQLRQHSTHEPSTEQRAAGIDPQDILTNGLPRADHHLLQSPAHMTRTAINFPDIEQANHYLSHSADITMHGGVASALVHPLASCALAEHYVFRRVGGASVASATAAMTAAAELGRTAPQPQSTAPTTVTVRPGFAGLAEATGWLAGFDPSFPCPDPPANAADADPHRLARMLVPTWSTRGLYRLLATLAHRREVQHPRLALTAAVMGLVTPGGWALLLLVAACMLGAWMTVTVGLVRWQVDLPLVIIAATTLGLTLLVVVGALLALLGWTGLRRTVARRAQREYFGLIPGVDLPGPLGTRRHSRWGSLLDRQAGMPAGPHDQVPPLMEWVTDRIDDLAGIPARTAPGTDADAVLRPTLTFGELWLGRLGPVTEAHLPRLRLAEDDPSFRVIDLMVVASNISQSRPCSFPLRSGERADREGGSRYLFCRACLAGVVPLRVVSQVCANSPAHVTETTCPRHPSQTLHELPDPWNFPVALAVRMSLAVTGLLRAVPLFTLEVEVPRTLFDEFGRMVAAPPPNRHVLVPRVQWFADGGVTSGMPNQIFDTRLPRWPTFALAIEDVPTTPVAIGENVVAGWLHIPEQDASAGIRSWRRVSTAESWLGAVVRSALGWRSTLQADVPGVRGRLGVVRTSSDQHSWGWWWPTQVIGQVIARGYHSGVMLRERFTSSDFTTADSSTIAAATSRHSDRLTWLGDDDPSQQTQTDRYRWIRMRMALREYRELSVEISARLPLYRDLASNYRVPEAVTPWFTPPIQAGSRDPAWSESAAAITHLRALSAGGVLDWDTDYGAPPADPDLRLGGWH